MAVIAFVLAGLSAALVACGSSGDEQGNGQNAADTKQARKDCTREAASDASYAGRFEGPVSMDQREHVIRVTRNGHPVSGAGVCVNTAMVGMSTMKYSARGHELAPGRYRVNFKFEMEGTYRGKVLAKKGSREVSIPMTVKVPSHDMKSGAMKDDMKSGGMKDDTKSRGKKTDGN